MASNPILVEMHYLAPIEYYARICQHPEVHIEKYEHYQKGSYRNRCYIASPEGKLMLSIPLSKGKNQRTLIKDVRIANDAKWQKIHWQSLGSFYRSSPYFEYYEDKFTPFYHKTFEFLFDFNEQLMNMLFELMELKVNITFTKKYEDDPEGVKDMRSVILPNANKTTAAFKAPEYKQVFEEKTGFLPNLSIVDMLFSEGPNARELLLSGE